MDQLEFNYNNLETAKIFDGSDIEPEYDNIRLSKQMARIFNYMKNGQWKTLEEISENTKAPHSSVSAQLRNLRKAEFGSHTIEKQSRGNRINGLWEYKLIPNPQIKIQLKK